MTQINFNDIDEFGKINTMWYIYIFEDRSYPLLLKLMQTFQEIIFENKPDSAQESDFVSIDLKLHHLSSF